MEVPTFVTCLTERCHQPLFRSVSGTYRSLRASYHNSVYLILVYKPPLSCLECEVKTIKTWSENRILSASLLWLHRQATFLWRCNDIYRLTETVTSYITFYVGLLIRSKWVVTYFNEPWISKELKYVTNKGGERTLLSLREERHQQTNRYQWSSNGAVQFYHYTTRF